MAENQYYAINSDVKFGPLCLIDGRLVVDVEDRGTVKFRAAQGFTVPKGVLHRTRAPERTAMLMVESAGIRPSGD